MSKDDKQKNKEIMKEYLKEYRKTRFINVLKSVKVDVVTNCFKGENDNNDDIRFSNDGHHPLDGSPLGFR